MMTVVRDYAVLLLGFALPLLSSCGTTTVASHPSLAPTGDGNAARVYFLRPDIGYTGVMQRAFTLSLDGKDLLTLATGEYALAYLKPASAIVTVESWTVPYGSSAMTKVKESRPFLFEAGKTYYLAFGPQTRLPESPVTIQQWGGMSVRYSAPLNSGVERLLCQYSSRTPKQRARQAGQGLWGARSRIQFRRSGPTASIAVTLHRPRREKLSRCRSTGERTPPGAYASTGSSSTAKLFSPSAAVSGGLCTWRPADTGSGWNWKGEASVSCALPSSCARKVSLQTERKKHSASFSKPAVV